MTALTIAQGTDAGVRWLVNDGDTGQPFDFTGWTVRSQIRDSAISTVVLHEWSTLLGNASASADGYVTLTWTAAQTSAWKFSEAMYDIELTSGGYKVMRLDSGRITVSGEVTR